MYKNFRKEQYIREDLENEFEKFISSLRFSTLVIDENKRKFNLKKLLKREDTYILQILEKGWDREIELLKVYDLDKWKYGEYDPSISKYRLKSLPRDLKAVIREFIDYYHFTHNPNYEEYLRELKENLKPLNVDDEGRYVSKEQWLQAANDCDNPRFHGDSRAVIVDDCLVCINAAAAIENFEGFEEFRQKRKTRDPRKDGDLLYKACEVSNGSFKGHRVRYAEKDEILAQVEIIKGE